MGTKSLVDRSDSALCRILTRRFVGAVRETGDDENADPWDESSDVSAQPFRWEDGSPWRLTYTGEESEPANDEEKTTPGVIRDGHRPFLGNLMVRKRGGAQLFATTDT